MAKLAIDKQMTRWANDRGSPNGIWLWGVWWPLRPGCLYHRDWYRRKVIEIKPKHQEEVDALEAARS